MCYETKRIIMTTNLQFGHWNHVFQDPVLTGASLSPAISLFPSDLIVFNGDSHRIKRSIIQK